MNGRPNYAKVDAYTAATPAPAAPKKQPSSSRRTTQPPQWPLAAKTWRAWASYLLSGRHVLPAKDARHLTVCIMQHGYLRKWQMRWIFDIVARHEPSGCGTWGAPD